MYDLDAGRWAGAFFAFDPGFRGGVHLATAPKINEPGPDLLVVGAGAGGGPAVRVLALDGSADRAFFAYDEAFRGGVRVDCDGAVVTTLPGAGGGPVLARFDLAGGELGRFYVGPPDDLSGAYALAPAGLGGGDFPYVIDGPGGAALFDPTTGRRVG